MTARADIPIGEAGIKQYFSLLHALLPKAERFLIQDSKSQVVAVSDASEFTAVADGPIQLPQAVTSARVSRISNDYGGCMYAADLMAYSGDAWGQLIVIMPEEQRSDDQRVMRALQMVSGFIDNEYRLTAELDAMAEELTDRYEELNLMYDNVHELLEVQSQGDAINHVVEHCAEHLNVGIVALVFEESDKVFYATSDAFAMRPYELIKHYDKALIRAVQKSNSSVIINDMSDPLNKAIDANLPYKILASPIAVKRGQASAALICITSIDDKDFMNSDRNLLEVMAKRITKILQANRDDLTGLMNTRVLEVVLRRSINTAREEGVFHSFLNIDLHQLKVLNDNHGRDGGDKAIEHVGTLLANALRATDNIGYLGEGRFGILLERCSMDEGLKVADSLCELVEQSDFSVDDKPTKLSVSVGGTLVEPHTKSVDDILEAAEIAQEAAKHKGQSRIQAYLHDDKDLHSRRREMRWVSRIQAALANDQFRLHCQSIVPSFANGERFHFEVLLRLLDEDGEYVSPASFIPPAEKYNLMPSVDRWVIDNSLQMLADSGIDMSSGSGMISINLSGQTLDDPDLANYIKATLQKTGVPASWVCFEITETAAFGHLDLVTSLLDDLKALGCKLSLDDFGTGLSSFSYLKTLPVDVLKIDGSFVSQILVDPVSQAMVNSINEIGHVMNLRTVAEFVETPEIAQRLREMGIDYLQGYGMAKPEPLLGYLKALVT